jgi:hypothetical protein
LIEEELEDSKGVIRIRKSKKDKQHNVQKKNDKRTNNDVQNITHTTYYRRQIKRIISNVFHRNEWPT